MGGKIHHTGGHVILRVDRGPTALPLLRVVIGGMASQHDLSVEQLDDLQLAVETLMAEEWAAEGNVVLELWSEGAGLSLRLGGLANTSVKTALGRAEPPRFCDGHRLDVRVLLESLVDSYAVDEGADGTFGVRMEKRA